MEEQNEILAAIEKLDQKFEARFDQVDARFAQFAAFRKDFDKMHGAVIGLEGLRSDVRFIAEDVADLKKRFAAWEEGEDEQPSIPARVSALEVRVTRLEKKKGRN
jgi:hypothetical protein